MHRIPWKFISQGLETISCNIGLYPLLKNAHNAERIYRMRMKRREGERVCIDTIRYMLGGVGSKL